MSRTYNAPSMAAGAGDTRSETAETLMVEIDTTGPRGFEHTRGRRSARLPTGGIISRD